MDPKDRKHSQPSPEVESGDQDSFSLCVLSVCPLSLSVSLPSVHISECVSLSVALLLSLCLSFPFSLCLSLCFSLSSLSWSLPLVCISCEASQMPWAQHLRGPSLSCAIPAFGMSPRVSPSLIVYLGHLACLTLGQAQLFSLSPIYSLCLSDSLLKLSVCFCLAHDLWSLLISTDQHPALPASLGT